MIISLERRCPEQYVGNAINYTGSCTTVELSYRTRCSYSCRRGFKRSGSETITCQWNKTWSPSPPVCNRKKEKKKCFRLMIDNIKCLIMFLRRKSWLAYPVFHPEADDERLLSSQSPLSGHIPVPPGWRFNRCSTVVYNNWFSSQLKQVNTET